MDKKYYEEKIMQATPMGLVIISYEMLLESLDLAVKTVETDNEQAGKHIMQAQNVLRSIMSGLNLDIELSNELLDIYMYINAILIDCQIKCHRVEGATFVAENVAHLTELLNSLLDGIKAVPDTDLPAVALSQQIHAGMTYDKDGNLSEFIQQDPSKTYQA